MSYTQLIYHIVIRTHGSRRTISEAHERELYNYMFGIARNRNVVVYRIGGMPDHVHLLVGLPSDLSVAKFVQELKSVTSTWLKANPKFPSFDHWGKEYAAFTYSAKERDVVINYIKGQKEHHRTLSFAEEYRQLIEESGIAINEQYFLRE